MKERFKDLLTNKDNDYRHAVPQDSYSRELDSRVQESEMPYGYSTDSPQLTQAILINDALSPTNNIQSDAAGQCNG